MTLWTKNGILSQCVALDGIARKCSNCHAGNCDMMGLTLGEVQRSFSSARITSCMENLAARWRFEKPPQAASLAQAERPNAFQQILRVKVGTLCANCCSNQRDLNACAT